MVTMKYGEIKQIAFLLFTMDIKCSRQNFRHEKNSICLFLTNKNEKKKLKKKSKEN